MQWEAQRRGTVMEEGGEVAQLRIRFELEGEGVKTERTRHAKMVVKT